MDPVVLAGLARLLGEGDMGPSPASVPESPALAKLAGLGTPKAVELWSRYKHIGLPMTEALSLASHPLIDNRIVESARWARDPEVRAAALRALAARRNAADQKHFEEALVPADPVLHFALLEALEEWDRPEAVPLIERLATGNYAPVVRVRAARLLMARKNPAGRAELLKQLDGGDWLARAMAADAVGSFGAWDDYNLLLDRLTREQANEFVVAELAVGALRLFARHSPFVGRPPPASLLPDPSSDPDALVVTAPRLKIPPTALIDGRINAHLLRLLEEKAEAKPSALDRSTPSAALLGSLVTPAGIALQVRYGRLGFLLTEGLAGTTDLIVRDRMLRVARSASDPRIRSVAMLALAYEGNMNDRAVFEAGVLSEDPALRFGAIEALRVWGRRSGLGQVFDLDTLAQSDPLGAYVAGGGIPAIRWIDDPDWVVRSLAIRSGGVPKDKLISILAADLNPFVRAEVCAALVGSPRLR